MGRLPTQERPWSHSLGTKAVRLSGAFSNVAANQTCEAVQGLSAFIYSWFTIRKEVPGRETRALSVQRRSTNCRKVAFYLGSKCAAGRGRSASRAQAWT
jgi:hypothetical protein